MICDTDIYIGRQPIFDKNGKCVSYELLYRHTADVPGGAEFSDNATATTRVIINLIHNIGLSSIIGDKTGYINVDEQIIMSDVLLSLPTSKFVFEILEYTKMSDDLVTRIRDLHQLGYRFALDDFACTAINIEYFNDIFPYIDTVKIDLLEMQDITPGEIFDTFKSHDVTLLAEKVENVDMFHQCRDAGFELFQGYFFEKPSILSGKKIEPSVTNAIDMINTLRHESDMGVISEKFALYPELTFNLLRYVNSAEFHFKEKITSIRQILLLLGPSRLSSWLGLFLYSGANEQLFREAIADAARFRASMMREIVIAHGRKELADEAFLAGSLSLIDAYLQIRMDDILEKIHLSREIKDALLGRAGYLGKILSIAEKLETSEKLHNVIVNLAPKLNMTPDCLYTIYCHASGGKERQG